MVVTGWEPVLTGVPDEGASNAVALPAHRFASNEASTTMIWGAMHGRIKLRPEAFRERGGDSLSP